jgi:hypothetical protein
LFTSALISFFPVFVVIIIIYKKVDCRSENT